MDAEGWQLPPHGPVCLKELVADFYHEQGRCWTLPLSRARRFACTTTNEWIFSELYIAFYEKILFFAGFLMKKVNIRLS